MLHHVLYVFHRTGTPSPITHSQTILSLFSLYQPLFLHLQPCFEAQELYSHHIKDDSALTEQCYFVHEDYFCRKRNNQADKNVNPALRRAYREHKNTFQERKSLSMAHKSQRQEENNAHQYTRKLFADHDTVCQPLDARQCGTQRTCPAPTLRATRRYWATNSRSTP